MREQPFVSVIIPVYNDTDRLRACLELLARQTYPSSQFEVLVVDNGSNPPVPDAIATGNVVLIREPRPGSYVSRNTAIAASRGDLLVFTDADCLPATDWLEAMMKAVPDDRTIVAGKIELLSRDPLNPSPSERLDMFWNFRQDRFVTDGWGTTANLAVARTIFDRVGPFNAFQLSGGDREWCLRAMALGFSIRYAADARIRHPARATLQQHITQTRRYTGGAFFRSKAGPEPHGAHALYLLARPPLRRLFQVAFAPGLGSTTDRAQIAAILVTLRLVALVEWVRLSMGSERERR